MRPSPLTAALLACASLSALFAVARVERVPDAARGELIDLSTLEPERRFDFLAGHWTYAFDGGHGRTRYELVLDGEAVRETLGPSMLGERTFVGSALFVFDAQRARWTQNWIDTLGNVLHGDGKLEPYGASDLPAMILEFEHQGTRLRHVWYDVGRERFETDLLVQRGADQWALVRRMPYLRQEQD